MEAMQTSELLITLEPFSAQSFYYYFLVIEGGCSCRDCTAADDRMIDEWAAVGGTMIGKGGETCHTDTLSTRISR
jgi:hypothetical protein